ncbi:MAG: hypothetical protein JRN19_01275 [Nitrososphaerota archaeon]|nr:hypothetical protein [Nitrososphaerota archaeon]MDG7048541.1 hypothetical protein [Nitrososphaerota archaeon]MDG7051072.1 hypothetical protein [Nitrososphaerota archaeon]
MVAPTAFIVVPTHAAVPQPVQISITPTSGAAGTSITVSGKYFTVDGTASVMYTVMNATTNQEAYNVTHTGIPVNSTGGFTYTFNAPELALNTTFAHGGYESNILISANDTITGDNTTVTFTEQPRQLLEFKVTSPSGTINQTTNYIKTATNINSSMKSQINTYVQEPIQIAANYFDPSSTVTFAYNGTSIGTAMTNSTGFFNTTITLPISPYGKANLTMTDPLAMISLNTHTLPTLTATPSSVTPTSSVTLSGYAFNENAKVNVTFLGLIGSIDWSNVSVANLTSSSLGEFTTSYAIPYNTFGGTQLFYVGYNTLSVRGANNATVTVTPLSSISPLTTPIGGTINATAWGLNAGINGTAKGISLEVPLGHSAGTYLFAYDNQPVFGSSSVKGVGNASILMSAVGTPGQHIVQIVNATSSPYTLIASSVVNVTGSIPGVTSQVSGLATTLATIESSLTSITSSLTSLSSAVTSIGAGITSIESSLTSITSSISSISGTLTSMGSTLTSIQTAVSGLNTSNLASTLSNVMTYLLVVAVLAIIIIVLEIVLLVRKK